MQHLECDLTWRNDEVWHLGAEYDIILSLRFEDDLINFYTKVCFENTLNNFAKAEILNMCSNLAVSQVDIDMAIMQGRYLLASLLLWSINSKELC